MQAKKIQYCESTTKHFRLNSKTKNCFNLWFPATIKGALCTIKMGCKNERFKNQFLPIPLIHLLMSYERIDWYFMQQMPTQNGEYQIIHSDYSYGYGIKKIRIEDDTYQIWDDEKSNGFSKKGGWKQKRNISRIGKWAKYCRLVRRLKKI